jgi:predicted DNA-binding WGR domain protein
VEVADQSVTTTYGRIGTAGQTQTKRFGDPLAAQNHADKLFRQKLAKGYVQQQEA